MLTDGGTRTVETYLRFANTSARQIRVVDVKPSCGCISTVLSKETFASGEKGEIKAIFEIGKKMGREEKYIEISTDELDNATYRVNLVVNVPQWLDVEQSDLVWPVSSVTKQQFIHVWSPLNRPLEIVLVNYNSHRLKVEIPSGNKAESSYLISVQPVSTTKSMLEGGTLHVRFNELERDIVIYGQVK